MSTEKRKSTSSRLIVAAIDFGTTYSGYAYSFKSDWTKVFMNKWEGGQLTSHKAPTTLLLNPDTTFNSFGYEAEKTYADIATDGDDDGRSCTEYYFFHRFKMMLKTTLTKRVHRETNCTDENGREVRAIIVFSYSIRYLKDHLLDKLLTSNLGDKVTVDDIDFVLTVPAIWDDTAKMFMREAAIQAGIPDDQLEIALEPEAASIYCHLMHLDDIQSDNTTDSFTRGSGVKYMVVDLGGGTADITVHQLQENKTLAELVPASGGEWGGTNVDKAYRQFLEDIFGSSVLKKFKSDPDNIIDFFEFWQNFEVKKREPLSSKSSSKMNLVIPVALTEIAKEQKKLKGTSQGILKELLKNSKYWDKDISCEAGKLSMSIEIFENLFNPTVQELIAHVSKMFKDELDADVKTILLVGGFSECELVRDRLRGHFGKTKRLVFPCEASLAILKGAVYFGHCKDLISRRVARFTYGFQIWPKFDKSKYSSDRKKMVNGEERCRDVFLKIVTKGDPITPGLKKSQIFKPLQQGENVLECGVFVSNQKDPKYVDDPGCVKLGTLEVKLTNYERQTNAEIEESIIFGETYIKATAYNCRTNEEHERTFDLLSPNINLPGNLVEVRQYVRS